MWAFDKYPVLRINYRVKKDNLLKNKNLLVSVVSRQGGEHKLEDRAANVLGDENCCHNLEVGAYLSRLRTMPLIELKKQYSFLFGFDQCGQRGVAKSQGRNKSIFGTC